MTSLAGERTETAAPEVATRRWNLRPVGILFVAWFVLQFSGIFSPGLLDDVDSIYIEIAREMLQRHDFVTPYINGIRFFDKPPLMYWMAAGSMKVFGVSDWAARLPLAIAVLALLLSTYALGNRLFSRVSPEGETDRPGFYSALALATGIGPYLYTRFFIPDILIALWMTLGIHLFLIALERITASNDAPSSQQNPPGKVDMSAEILSSTRVQSAVLPCLGFAAVLALNLLTKGLIGLVFPLAFVVLYLGFTRQLRLLLRFHLLPGTLVFLVIAAPWHVLAALRNPAIALPAGLGLPARGGWAWFYLYNEHVARFLSRRIPHDYGQTPVWLFWLYVCLWIMPWTAFLPAALPEYVRAIRKATPERERQAALTLLLWAGIVLGFFTLSARQEYYSLPAIPALAMMAGDLLSRADRAGSPASRSVRRWSTFFLVPITAATAVVCGYFALAAPRVVPGSTLSSLLANNPELYNLSLGHLFDLTGAALGLFRGPLTAVAAGMVAVGILSTALRWRHQGYAANLTLAGGMTVTLLAAHAGLSRFNPILGSKDLALSINRVIQPSDLIVLDGELTTGSTLIFYTRREVHLVNGRRNGLWYGSFWADAPDVFETEASLRSLWSSPRHVFLLTYSAAQRQQELAALGPTSILADSGGKAVLTNFVATR